MYKYFTFNPKDMNDFFKEDDIYKYCKSCHTKSLKATKFCMECGSKEFYDDYKSYLKATTKYCTVCLSKVTGNRCSCGSTSFASVDKVFDNINASFNSKISDNSIDTKNKIEALEAKIKSKESELKTTINKIDNLLKSHEDYLKELALIEKNKQKELKKYQIVEKKDEGLIENINFADIQGLKVILETKQELLMEKISKLDNLGKKEEAMKFIEDIYSARFTSLNLKETFKEDVRNVNEEYVIARDKSKYSVYNAEVVKRLNRAAEAKHPGAIQMLGNLEIRNNHDYKQYLIKHLQALDLLSVALQSANRKDNGVFENIASIFVTNLGIFSLTSEENDSVYLNEIAKRYEDAAKQYANSPSQNKQKR